jgi:hypothetical protein
MCGCLDACSYLYHTHYTHTTHNTLHAHNTNTLHAHYTNTLHPHRYDGAIARVNDDGTYALHYDDGDREEYIPASRLRRTSPSGKLDCEDGTVVTCSGVNAVPLSNLFDQVCVCVCVCLCPLSYV